MSQTSPPVTNSVLPTFSAPVTTNDQTPFQSNNLANQLFKDFKDEKKVPQASVTPTTNSLYVIQPSGAPRPPIVSVSEHMTQEEKEEMIKANMKIHSDAQAWYNEMIVLHPKLVDMIDHPKWDYTDARVRKVKTPGTMPSALAKFKANLSKYALKADEELASEHKVTQAKEEKKVKESITHENRNDKPSPASLANQQNSRVDHAIMQGNPNSDGDDDDDYDEEEEDDEDSDELLALGMFQLELAAANGAVLIGKRYKVHMPSLVAAMVKSKPMIIDMWRRMFIKYPDHPWVKALKDNPFFYALVAHAEVLNALANDLFFPEQSPPPARPAPVHIPASALTSTVNN